LFSNLTDVAIVGGVGADDIEELLDVDILQFVVVPSQVPFVHELSDLRIALPIRKKKKE
jgi:hypothetical protein